MSILFVLDIWECTGSYLIMPVHSGALTGSYFKIVATQLIWDRSTTPRTFRELSLRNKQFRRTPTNTEPV